ncbi:hypothetical protein [Mucilaginibacter aquatilis]|uniref:Uncharacterized protein n=1 Tax=Mucilaginibacter aquatilis TaxID=1517760 RepID=A0A6I4IAX6_9SPHI|nr:hypothetical protein [Mucilaginibacter aquatilis]MVN90686.1 hypothetical protein [Mucilaginibacter aquatilis]
MKLIRNILGVTAIALSLAACGNSQDKSVGGSSDTTENASDVGATSVGGLDSTRTDSTTMDSSQAEGNATPTGRP